MNKYSLYPNKPLLLLTKVFVVGGVQNSLRKERKDKKSDEAADKKDKKPAGPGIRSTRGFM